MFRVGDSGNMFHWGKLLEIQRSQDLKANLFRHRIFDHHWLTTNPINSNTTYNHINYNYNYNYNQTNTVWAARWCTQFSRKRGCGPLHWWLANLWRAAGKWFGLWRPDICWLLLHHHRSHDWRHHGGRPEIYGKEISLEIIWSVVTLDVLVQLLRVPFLHCNGVWADWRVQARAIRKFTDAFMDGEICAFILCWWAFWFSICFMFQGIAKARGMGSMAILTSFVFLVDTVFNIMAMWNGQ